MLGRFIRDEIVPIEVACRHPAGLSSPCRLRATMTWRTLGAARAASVATSSMRMALPRRNADVGGDQDLRLRVIQPGRDRLCSEAREDRYGDRADLRARQKRDHRFRDQRQEQPNGIAPSQLRACRSAFGEPAGLRHATRHR